ncbi:MAG: DUF1573 domain-containing protein [Ignavibacteria bacterium]|nr:DUF1573 domain-containing protein [Ignavibacteria bacterium]
MHPVKNSKSRILCFWNAGNFSSDVLFNEQFQNRSFHQLSKISIRRRISRLRKVPQGPQVEYSFKFTNKGKSPLIIEKVQTSCGCTGATTGGKNEYAKGESGEVKITFNTQGREGRQEKHIMVFTNDPDLPQKDLKFSCDIDTEMK